MKGIILAGGSGSRLYPLTNCISKQLLPVYDKPLIYYPLSILMMAGIKDILIISTPDDVLKFKELLGDGTKFGINLNYAVQPSPGGLAQAFIIGESFINNEPCALILGDNIFHGAGLIKHLKNSVSRATNENKATIFGFFVKDPNRYGIIEFDNNNSALSIEEKPVNPKSNCVVTGLYFYPKGVCELAKRIKPSKRGELEITDINNLYLSDSNLHVTILGRGYSWIDAGTYESLLEASLYIKFVEEHQSLMVCCPEEIAFNNGWISKHQLIILGESMSKNQYGQHLLNVANGKVFH